MICPKCGATNREGASYCDSCGEPLLARLQGRQGSADDDWSDEDDGAREPLVGSGGLVGWMAMDWLLRFAVVTIIGIIAGVLTLGIGEYGFSVFFFILGIVGIIGTWYMLRADR